MIESATLSRSRFASAMIALILIEVLSSFEHVMMIAALPSIARDLGLTPATWTITAFLLVQASTAAIGARLGDMYGRKRVTMVLLTICVAGSLLSAIGESALLVIIGRGLQGFSGALLPLCYGMARQIVPPRQIAFWIGTLTGGITIASAFGYILGGYFADLGDWRLIFWFATGYGVILLPIVLLVIPHFPGNLEKGRIDFLGGFLLAPGIAASLFGVISAAQTGVAAPLTLATIIGGPILLAWWWWHEWHRADPLIQVRLFAQRPILIANGCFALAGLGVMQLPLVVMQFLQQPMETGTGLSVSATMSGILKLPSNIGSLGAAMFAGWLCGRIGGRRVVQFGGLLAAGAWAALILFHDNQWQIMVILIFGAAGSTTLLSAIPNLVLENSPPDRASEATGLSIVVFRIFTAVGSQVVAFMLAASALPAAGGGRAYPTQAGYTALFVAIAITGLLIAVLAARGAAADRAPRGAFSPHRGMRFSGSQKPEEDNA